MHKKIAFLVFFFSFVVIPTLSADEYHNQQVLIGEKAAGIGGTFVAIGDGAEACYYNPAGLTQLKISYISVSSQVFEYKEISGKFLNNPNEKFTSMSFVPSFWGLARDLKKHKFGFSIVVPAYDAYKMHEQYKNLQWDPFTFDEIRIDRINNNQTYLIGPSIAREINPDLSIGLTLYFRYLDISTRNTNYYNASMNGVPVAKMESNSEESGSGMGGYSILGILYKLNDSLNLGLSFKQGTNNSNTIDVIKRDYIYSYDVPSNKYTFRNAYLEKQIKHSSKVPPSITLGTKWKPTNKLTTACDISYLMAADYTKETYELDNTTLTDYKQKTSITKLEDIINLNFGTEYMLDNNIPFRFGLFTDRSTAPKVEDNNTSQPMHIDNYGLTLSSGILSENSTMVFGFKYGWGSGRMTNLDFLTGKYKIDKVKTSNYAFNLSGSYNF